MNNNNNLDANFMSPMSRPPATKKQRGGTTPRSVVTRSTTATPSGGPPGK